MRVRQYVLGCILLLHVPLFGQEPSGGILTDLVFFDDIINPKARIRWYTGSDPVFDTVIVHDGRSSYRQSFGSYAGMQVFWYGTTNDGPDWSGPDTSVFWAQPDSRVQMWFRASSVGTGPIAMYLLDNLGSNLGTIYEAPIPAANQWYLIDTPLPESVRNIPLKRIDISLGPGEKTVWVDDFKVTDVRLYAGKSPARPANMSHIAASQIGFAPFMRKQFSSPVSFSSFDIRRVDDNTLVYTGGGVVRSDSDAVIGGDLVWIGDFSGFSIPGRYKIVTGGKESYPFTIGGDVFDQATRAAERFFYYQRAFTAIEQRYAEGPWVHSSDAAKAPPGVVKGWHDAGDLTVYNATMTQALFWLLETWSDFRPMDDSTNIPESGNGVPDLLDEARWGLEWLRSMEDPGGGFWANATAANGYNTYSYGSTFPQTVAPYIKTVAPCVQATAKAAAVLAYASKVYRPFSQDFADSCLASARRGWTWLVAHPDRTDDGSPDAGGSFNIYAQGNDQHLLRSNIMWAAAALLYATGESQFATAFEQNFERMQVISSYSRSEGFAASLYLRASAGTDPNRKNQLRSDFFALADQARREALNHPFQVAAAYYWGSCSNLLHASGQYFWKSFLLDSTRVADRDAALQSLDYIFGRNYLTQCYVSGITGTSQPRLRGFHHWMKALNATPYHFPGALAGGPNQSPDINDRSYPNAQPYPIWGYWGDTSNPRLGRVPVEGRYTDNDSWSTNEVAVNWNAVLVYNLHGARLLAHGSSLPVLPSGSLLGVPDTVSGPGGNVTLTWTSSNALSARIDPGVGEVPVNGSMTLQVQRTTEFFLTVMNAIGNQTYSVTIVVGTQPPTGNEPKDFFLSQNFPNPFNPETLLTVEVPRTAQVDLAVYNMLGQKVRTLFTGEMNQGRKEILWDGTNDRGVALGSGTYFCRMMSGNFVSTVKAVLLR